MWDLLDRFHMRDLFQPVMTADIVQPKPSPEGVLRILQTWGTPPDRVGFVGDSLTDAKAARGGLVPLLAYRNPRLDADLHLTSFSTFHQALQALLGAGLSD